MTKNPAEIAGTRYKNEKLMSRVQKTDGTSRCFAQIENIKRQSLIMTSENVALRFVKKRQDFLTNWPSKHIPLKIAAIF